MTIENEGNQGPVSPEGKQALEELIKEGHKVAEPGTKLEETPEGTFKSKPLPEEKVIVEDKAALEAKAKEDANVALGLNPDGSKKEDKKDRDISYIPAYKLKILEDQKNREIADLTKKIEEFNKQPDKKEEKDINKAIAELAEKYETDPKLLTELKDLIESQGKLSPEIEEKLKKLDKIDEVEKFKNDSIEKDRVQTAENDFSNEFEKNILPLIKAENPQVSEDVIKSIKEGLKPLAFSEGYNKLPLKKIFLAEKESFKIPAPVVGKKTTEDNKSGIVRTDTEINFDNITAEQFANLTPKEVEAFQAHKKASEGSGWNRK